jgi:hypothetical protein
LGCVEADSCINRTPHAWFYRLSKSVIFAFAMLSVFLSKKELEDKWIIKLNDSWLRSKV